MRVGHGHDQHPPALVDRDKPKLAHRFNRDSAKSLEIDSIAVERLERQPILLSQRLGPGCLGQYLIAHQRGTQLPLRSLRLSLIRVELLSCEESTADEDVGEGGL